MKKLDKVQPTGRRRRTSEGAVTRKADTKVTRTGPGSIQVEMTKSLDDLLTDICKSTGTRCNEVAFRIVDQVAQGLVRPKPTDIDAALIQAISTIAEMAPQNLPEAMLCSQMVVVNDVAMKFMADATRDEQTSEGRDLNVNRSVRLMRLFAQQIEMLARLRGQLGQQKITVERVDVREGGRAVIGAIVSPVGTPGGGG